MMRIIGGVAKGRRLASFKGLSIRPTSDKAREAIFNILPQAPFKKVLDLFAGTGAMGAEALSRGAEEAVFVDKSPTSIRVIKKNLEICGFLDRATVLQMDVDKALRILGKKGERFDLIFIDPPYQAGLMGKTLMDIDEKGIILPGGVVVAESSKRLVPAIFKQGMVWNGELKRLKSIDRRIYGDTVVTFYKSDQKHKTPDTSLESGV
ncbi:MAG: 16S rRNA (guanine(966)-N(2))-methyltransferase RsmD [Deltaproteobacteria bacterium]|nr:16S rRNA (guanine(966)-N(2))-methyltransferase RsmD [Deltaproteobacteria bacterium]